MTLVLVLVHFVVATSVNIVSRRTSADSEYNGGLLSKKVSTVGLDS